MFSSTVSRILCFDASLSQDSTARLFTVNGVSFKPPPVPVLLQILNGTQNPHDLLPVGSVIPLPLNATVELQMPGGVVGGGHPIHLHGVRSLPRMFWFPLTYEHSTAQLLGYPECWE